MRASPIIKRNSRVAVLALLCASGTLYGQNESVMRAIQMHSFGGPEVLQVHNIAIPDPAEDEILIRVHAAGVNPIDTLVRRRSDYDISGAKPPYVPGFDVSGVVTKVGSTTSPYAVGDEVFAMLSLQRGGGYAEYAIVKNEEAALKPDSASHDEAASIPLVALTAWQALFDKAQLKAGQTVLIHAGAGGVGSVAVQLAKWRGARVVATASEHNHDFLRSIGTDVPVDYRTERFEDYVDEVDVVLDSIGFSTQDRSIDVLKKGGILVSLVGLTWKGRNPKDVRVIPFLVKPNGMQLQQISDLIDAGHVKPIVSYRFSLEEAPQSHRQSQTRHTRGKIVLILD